MSRWRKGGTEIIKGEVAAELVNSARYMGRGIAVNSSNPELYLPGLSTKVLFSSNVVLALKCERYCRERGVSFSPLSSLE